MRPNRERDFRYERLENSLRLYRMGLALCLILILALMLALFGGRRIRIARAIQLDGEIVCLVPSKQGAARVREALLEPARQKLNAGNPAFSEAWQDRDWPVGENQVLTVAEAVEKLSPLLTVLVSAAAITVEGEQAAILPDRDMASKALEAVKAKFLRPDDRLLEQQQFAQKVEIRDVQVPPDLVSTEIGQTVERLLQGAKFTRAHQVRPRETVDRVARALGLTAAELLERVPRLKQGMKAGEEIKVNFQARPVVVLTVREVLVDRPYELPPQEVATTTLPPGQRRVALEGQPGVKKVTEKQLWKNDKLDRAVPLKGQVLQEAVPARIMVGAQPGAED